MSDTEFRAPTPNSSSVRADPAEIHGGVPTGFGQLLWHMFLATATNYPTRDAIVAVTEDTGASSSGPEASTQRWSYQGLLAKVDAAAHRLGHLGYGGTGNTLVVITRNVAEWGLLFWVAAKLGMTFIPLDPGAKGDLGLLLSASAPQVLVVEDDEMARTVEDWAAESKATVQAKITIADTTRDGWLSLSHIESEAHKLCQMNCQFDFLRAGGTGSSALIIFTSGTTGVPKACVHTHDHLMSQTHDYDPNPDPEFVDRWLIHTPVHHIFAINNALRAWRMGGAVILPSPTFSVRASLGAVVREGCTIMSATPTLIRAMLAESSCPDVGQFRLSIITLASTVISAEDIRLCKESLGCRHAIQAYGMSETGPVVSWCRPDPMLVDGFHPGVGKVLPGASIRICQPGTGEVLCVGDVGELHVSGTSVVDGYLNPESKSSFYVDGGRRWLMTGDQARVDEDGVVYILGRYKDLIIRGGENIDPATIEMAILSLANIEVQVVGLPDKVAGEVPVAVVKRAEDISNSAILEKTRSLGPKCTLGAIYDLSQLGLDEMPVTSLKKPRRQLLKAALSVFLQDLEKRKQELEQVQGSSPEQSVLVERLSVIWEDLCGVRPQLRQDVHTLADSILLMQYCDRVFRLLHTPLYLQDIFEHKDVFSQSALLLRRRSGSIAMPRPDAVIPSGNQHVLERDTAGKMGCHVETCPAIPSSPPVGVVAETVMLLRASQYRLVEGQRPQSYHIRLVYRIQRLSTSHIMEALQTLVRKTPVLRSVFVKPVDTGLWQHVLCGDGLIPNILHKSETSATAGEVKRRIGQDPSSALQPSYAFRADVVRCLDAHVLTLHFNHAAADALSLWSLLRNLDDLLRDPAAALPEPVPYRLWADLWQHNRTNALARSAISRLAGRLRGISRFPSALWPPRRAPGWMVADDSASPHRAARDAVRESTVWKDVGGWSSFVEDEFRFPRRGRIVRLPGGLDGARVGPEVLARCAVILLNVRLTRAPYAVFASWEAARSWPFVPAWIQPLLPPPMAVDGPTTQWRLNMYAASGAEGETVRGFLRRISDEERELLELNHAPWDDVKAALSEEAQVAEEASFRQGFVWDVTLGMSAQSGRHSSYQLLEPVSRHDWPDCGLFWNAFMVDKENLYFIASWDTSQLNGDEVDRYCDRLAEILRALANPDTWDRPLKEVSP
ncbi:AMP-binding enzyme family protein [Cordyceps fumosorosea ARSEF 2679]|uniref:AMP-binding enzyme family protein n=1 Tax=Cordyceps fumosorosea (strain ARSEF 2679) TaxID=1081104 RepID=A0A168BXP2_CORFA|nr:AMP-binding enzyme family protein [Cordyceps fumosorosea ARSEF 2679]OAA70680.1 AMP-binding enzyme family protein [Cordyceps fumosorosea ARSEF 2679]